MNREEYEELVNNIRDSLDDTTKATQSENFLNLISSYNNNLSELEDKNNKIKKLEDEKEELLKTNGKLFQQIGFKVEEKNNDNSTIEKPIENKLNISDIINEKGELI